MALNGLVEPAALPSVFVVFVYKAARVYASYPKMLNIGKSRKGFPIRTKVDQTYL